MNVIPVLTEIKSKIIIIIIIIIMKRKKKRINLKGLQKCKNIICLPFPKHANLMCKVLMMLVQVYMLLFTNIFISS